MERSSLLSCPTALLLLLLATLGAGQQRPGPGSRLHVLVLHPLYAGSHVLTLQAVTAKLLGRGHAVTTVRFRDSALPPLAAHPNLTTVELTINNSRADLPFVTAGEAAQFRLPLELIWASGGDLVWTLGNIQTL